MHCRERTKPALNRTKDLERASRVAPYVQALKQLTLAKPPSPQVQRQIDEFRWLIEEFKVSLFAQELRTAVPVSPQRLDEHLARIRAATE